MKIRLLAGLIVVGLAHAHVVGAQSNLDQLIDAPEKMEPPVNTPKPEVVTTSPETLALLDKLLLEEETPAVAPGGQPIVMPKPVTPPAYLFSPEDDDMTTSCDMATSSKVQRFDQGLAMALCQNPEMRMLALNLRHYLLDYKMSQSAWMPEINFISSGGSETDKYALEKGGDFKNRDRTTNYGVELNWLLFDFGKREAIIGQKENIWLTNQYQTLSSFQDFIISFAQNWYQVIAKRTIVVAAKENEKLARKTWDITQNKYRSGVGVLGDALQAENVLLSATQYRMQKEGEYEQSVGQLASALNLPVTQHLEPADTLDIPSEGQMMALKPMLDEAGRRHPLILAARKNIEAAQQQVNQAQRDFMPSISLQAGANRGDSSLDKQQYTINRTDTMYVGLNVSVPLFSGFRRYNQLQSANVQLSYSQQDYQKIVRDVGLNTWNAWQGLNTANRNYELISQRLKTAQRAYDIANGRYLTGVGTIVELLNTQQQLSNAEIDQANIKTDWYLQRLSLMASVGKLSLY